MKTAAAALMLIWAAAAAGAGARHATSNSPAKSNPPAKSTLIDASWAAYQRGDYTRAVNGFKRLARDGIVRAQINLGYLYATGTGVETDLPASAYWFRRAAQAGHVGAQATLGLYYYHGEGLERDIVAAHAWFAIAAAGGHPSARDYQRLAAQNMSPQQLNEAHRLAKKLYAQFGERKNLW